MDRGIVECNVCSTFPHMTSGGNKSSDFMILSPMPYPVQHMLQFTFIFINESEEWQTTATCMNWESAKALILNIF